PVECMHHRPQENRLARCRKTAAKAAVFRPHRDFKTESRCKAACSIQIFPRSKGHLATEHFHIRKSFVTLHKIRKAFQRTTQPSSHRRSPHNVRSAARHRENV